MNHAHVAPPSTPPPEIKSPPAANRAGSGEQGHAKFTSTAHREQERRLAELAIPVSLVTEINKEHELAFGKAREALEHARRAGELLLKAKAALPHGKWLPWIEEHCKFNERTVRGYMQLASGWERLTKTATVAGFGLRAALELLAKPKAQRKTGDGYWTDDTGKRCDPPAEGAVITTLCGTRIGEVNGGRVVLEKSSYEPKPEAPVEHGDHVVEHVVHDDADPVHQVDHPEQHVDGEVVRRREIKNMPISEIKVMPRGYWRDHPEAQGQLLVHLLESWDESSDETRREFFLILHGRDEFMPVVNANVRKAAA